LEIPIKACNRSESAFKANGQNGVVRRYQQLFGVFDSHTRYILLNRHLHIRVISALSLTVCRSTADMWGIEEYVWEKYGYFTKKIPFVY
jgi:hypothetical protein